MTWERHHVEVVGTAATGNPNRAADLLREHLAGVGCDALAVRITARLEPPAEVPTTSKTSPTNSPLVTHVSGALCQDRPGSDHAAPARPK